MTFVVVRQSQYAEDAGCRMLCRCEAAFVLDIPARLALYVSLAAQNTGFLALSGT